LAGLAARPSGIVGEFEAGIEGVQAVGDCMEGPIDVVQLVSWPVVGLVHQALLDDGQEAAYGLGGEAAR